MTTQKSIQRIVLTAPASPIDDVGFQIRAARFHVELTASDFAADLDGQLVQLHLKQAQYLLPEEPTEEDGGTK